MVRGLIFGLVVVVVSLPPWGYASRESDLAALKNSGLNFTNTGTICEEVARLDLTTRFQPPEYSVFTGIAYRDRSRIVGELDVVIFDNRNKTVVAVAEVKCWTNLAKGLRKAHEQLRRFEDILSSGRNITFYSKNDHSQTFTVSQFATAHTFLSVAQKGARAKGYDVELEYSRDELMEMREFIIRCQKSGDCPSPSPNLGLGHGRGFSLRAAFCESKLQ